MRTCVIFRGENLRHKRGLTSALDCVENWKETIFDVIDCDIVFFTYPSEILDELVEKLSPLHVCTSGYDSQESNTLAATNWMIEKNKMYDRFVLLRFDFMYRKKITEWPQWEQKGIILAGKTAHYPSQKSYHDIVFIVDHQWADQFQNASDARGRYKIGLHHTGRYLEEMIDVPLHIMYQDYYHILNNPLHSMHPLEPKPNILQDYSGEKILDVSPRN